MSGLPGGEVVSETPYTIDTDQPENLGGAEATPAPAVEWQPEPDPGPSDEERNREAWGDALELASRSPDPDDYYKLRREQIAKQKGDPSFYNADRTAQRIAIGERLERERAKEVAAELGSTPEVLEKHAQARERMAKAQVRIEHYEAQNPGFVERVKAGAAEVGDISYAAGVAIWESPHGAEIVDRIYSNPQYVQAINGLSERDLDKFVAHLEGAIEAERGYAGDLQSRARHTVAEIKPKLISAAPKPVTTIAGKSHNSGQSPNDMDYDTYKRWRQSQIDAKRPKGHMGGGR